MDKEIIRRIVRLERWKDELRLPQTGVWLDWTPVITQGVTVSHTLTFARYILINKTAMIRARLAITGAGTAGNRIIISGWPASINIAAGTTCPIGEFFVLDAGTSYYVGAFYNLSATTAVGRAHGVGGDIGITPNFALANGDTVSFMGIWETD